MSLREIGAAREDGDGLRRRWFSAPHLDLYVWQDAGDAIVKFQLCYDLGAERALSWERETGFAQHAVDSGEADPARNRSPVLMPDGGMNRAALAALLFGVRQDLPPEIHDFISERLATRGP
jgi:hypothetical protein